MIDEQSEDEVVVELNMDHPANREMMEFIKESPPGVVDAFFSRMIRRSVFNSSTDAMQGLGRFRRRMVVRSLVRMFRAGYQAGHMAGYRSGENNESKEATDGR